MMNEKTNDKEKIIIKFLLPNNYNYMINDEREKTIKKKSQFNFYFLIIIII